MRLRTVASALRYPVKLTLRKTVFPAVQEGLLNPAMGAAARRLSAQAAARRAVQDGPVIRLNHLA